MWPALQAKFYWSVKSSYCTFSIPPSILVATEILSFAPYMRKITRFEKAYATIGDFEHFVYRIINSLPIQRHTHFCKLSIIRALK